MSDATHIVELHDVCVEHQHGYETGLAGVNLTLASGELVAVRLRAFEDQSPLADVLMGLLKQASGRVLYRGDAWGGMSPAAAAAARAQIGRVFAGPAWISNLDIDENIQMKLRHHHLMDPSAAESEIQQLAQRFGVEDVLAQRPAWVARSALKRAQWVRALVCAPRLLVLESPDHEVDAGLVPAFAQCVKEALGRGAAVLWTGASAEELSRLGLSPSSQYQLLNGKWLNDIM